MRQFNPVYPSLLPIDFPGVTSHRVFMASGLQTISTVSREIRMHGWVFAPPDCPGP